MLLTHTGAKEPSLGIGLGALPSAFEHGYTEEDITRALLHPMGGRDHTPRDGVRTVIGVDMNDNPIVAFAKNGRRGRVSCLPHGTQV